MSFHHLDQFAAVDSAVTRHSPAARVLGTVLIALGAAVLPLGAWAQLAALGALAVALAAAARIPPRPFLARFLPPLAFVAVSSAALLVLAPGQVVATVGPLGITDAGLLRFASTTGRAAVALAAAVILVSTTSFPELIGALRSLRMPTPVTASLGLAYRYLYILTDEIGRLRRAARSRNAGAGAAPRRRLLLGITAAALQRSFARSERVHQAMLARGYDGAVRTLDDDRARRGGPAVAAVGAVVVTVVVAVVASAYL